MAILELARMTFREVEALAADRVVPILPVGAVEAHGVHLPLLTDVLISDAMAREGARRLARRSWQPLLLPALSYTAAPFAAGFAGTVSIRPETVTALVVDLGRCLGRHGFSVLALANSHLDPRHLASLHAAARALREAGLQVAFPDVTRKPWALRLTEEFRSGACHAGQYETSVVLAHRPKQVREGLRRQLAPNPASLSVAIRQGLGSFEEAGGPEAFFGDPAAASAAEGRRTIRVLGRILEEAVVEAVGEAPPGAG